MSIKRILTTLIFLLVLISVQSQTVQEIQNSGEFYYGTGEGNSYQEALKNAQDDLIGSISVQVSSEFTHLVQQENNDLNSYSEAVIKTYSTAVLHQLQRRLIDEQQNYCKVFAFLPKANVERAFTYRKQKVKDLSSLGEKAEKEMRIGDALRYYYWGLVLLRTLPDYNTVRYGFEGENENALIFSLPDKIDRIFANLKPEITNISFEENRQQKSIELNFSYHNKPVVNMDFMYFTGDGYSANYSIRDGRSQVRFTGAAANDLTNLALIIEYEYRKRASLEPEVKMMIEETKVPSFPASVYRIPLSVSTSKPGNPEPVFVTDNLQAPITEATTTIEKGRYQEKIRSILQSIRHGNHENIGQYFTSEGLDIYNSLIRNGRVSLLEQTQPLRVTSIGSETMVRSVPMMFSFANNTRSFVENVVFIFNYEGLINNISFALSDIAVSDIVSRSEDWGSTEEKYYLIRFMEDYKTAYSLKRLEYIESIFAENALIIVGHMLRKAEPIDMDGIGGRLSNDQIEYIRMSKTDYVERLKSVFSRNEFVNIHFEDNTVRRTTRLDERIYGIQIAQHYYSSTYADKGYLFLMIDLNDTLNPRIYVRTWQPMKNPDGSIYGLEDFRF